MCFGSKPKAPAQPKKAEFEDAPPVVTGKQESGTNEEKSASYMNGIVDIVPKTTKNNVSIASTKMMTL